MPLLKALILGVVQGITEFLPISSSGHLVLFQNLFGMTEPMLSFDIALHAGTLVAVLVYFRKEVQKIIADFFRFWKGTFCAEGSATPLLDSLQGMWWKILLTLAPTGIIAILFMDFFQATFLNLVFVSGAWLVMGILLVLSAKIKEGTKTLVDISWLNALVIGLVQGLSIMPGVSRSGSTILAGMFLGIKKQDAARFSFLMSVPAIIAATIMDLRGGIAYFSSHVNEVLIGFTAAAVTGYWVVKWLMKLIQEGRFFIFGYYCIAISILSFTLTFFIR